MSVRRLSSGGNEGSRPRGCRSNKCPQFWGSGLESNMLCRGITNAQTITKIAKVCCDRILLTHLSNFIILTFVLVSHEIFWRRYFAPLAWCVRGGGQLLPSVPRYLRHCAYFRRSRHPQTWDQNCLRGKKSKISR